MVCEVRTMVMKSTPFWLYELVVDFGVQSKRHEWKKQKDQVDERNCFLLSGESETVQD